MVTHLIFIAHSSKNEPYARMIRDSLSNIVEFQPYLAQDFSSFGDSFKERIQDAIEKCSFFICCLSKSGLESQWVNQELGYACAVKNQRKDYHINPISNTNLTLKGMITRDSEDILYQDKNSEEELIAKIVWSIRNKIRYGHNFGTLHFKVKCPSCRDRSNLPTEYQVVVPTQIDLNRMMREGSLNLMSRCPKCKWGTHTNIQTWNESDGK